MATVAGLLVSKPRPEMVIVSPILTVPLDNVIEGRVAGVDVGEGLGDGSAAVTWSTVSSWQEPFQQSRRVWSPTPLSGGTVIPRLTLPLPSALKGKVCRTLSSWISPPWFAGRWLALTVRISPARMVGDESESVGLNASANTKLTTPTMLS